MVDKSRTTWIECVEGKRVNVWVCCIQNNICVRETIRKSHQCQVILGSQVHVVHWSLAGTMWRWVVEWEASVPAFCPTLCRSTAVQQSNHWKTSSAIPSMRAMSLIKASRRRVARAWCSVSNDLY